MKKGVDLDPKEFIRSAIVKIETFNFIQSKNLKIYMDIEFKVNVANSSNLKMNRLNYKNLYCLGILVDGVWHCDSDHHLNEGLEELDQFEFMINKNGVYAVIFNPMFNTMKIKQGVYCGYICQDRKFFFVSIFIGLPFLIFLLFVFFKLYQKKLKEATIKTKKIFVEIKMKEIENVNVDFAG